MNNYYKFRDNKKIIIKIKTSQLEPRQKFNVFNNKIDNKSNKIRKFQCRHYKLYNVSKKLIRMRLENMNKDKDNKNY